MKKLLTILILVIVFTENVYAEIRKYKCNFSSNDYDLSFMNDENEFNLTNGELANKHFDGIYFSDIQLISE